MRWYPIHSTVMALLLHLILVLELNESGHILALLDGLSALVLSQRDDINTWSLNLLAGGGSRSHSGLFNQQQVARRASVARLTVVLTVPGLNLLRINDLTGSAYRRLCTQLGTATLTSDEHRHFVEHT